MSAGEKEAAGGARADAVMTSARKSKEDKILPNIHISLDKQKSQKRKPSKRMTIIKKEKGDKGDDAEETPRAEGEGSDAPDSVRDVPADAGGSGGPSAGDAPKDAPRSVPAPGGAAVPGGPPDAGKGPPGPDKGSAGKGGSQDPAGEGAKGPDAQGAKDKGAPADTKTPRSRGLGRLFGGPGAPENKAGKKPGDSAGKEGPEGDAAKPGGEGDATKDKAAGKTPQAPAAGGSGQGPSGSPTDKAGAAPAAAGALDKGTGKSPQDAAAGGAGPEGTSGAAPGPDAQGAKDKDAPTDKKSARGRGLRGLFGGGGKPEDKAEDKKPGDGAVKEGPQGSSPVPSDKMDATKGKAAPSAAAAAGPGKDGDDAGKTAPKGSAAKPSSALESAKDKVAAVKAAASAATALTDVAAAAKSPKDKDAVEAPRDATADGSGLKGADKDKEAPAARGRSFGKSFSALGRLWGGPGKDGKDTGKRGDGIPEEDSARPSVLAAPVLTPTPPGPGASGSKPGVGKAAGPQDKDGKPVGTEPASGETKGKEPMDKAAKGQGLEHRPQPRVPTADPDEDDAEEQAPSKGVVGKTLSGLGGLFRSKSRGAAVPEGGKGDLKSTDRAAPSDPKKVEPCNSKDQVKHDPTGKAKNVVDGVPAGGSSKACGSSIPTVMANKVPVALDVSDSEAGKAKAKKGGIPAAVKNAGIAGAFGALGLAFFFFLGSQRNRVRCWSLRPIVTSLGLSSMVINGCKTGFGTRSEDGGLAFVFS